MFPVHAGFVPLVVMRAAATASRPDKSRATDNAERNDQTWELTGKHRSCPCRPANIADEAHGGRLRSPRWPDPDFDMAAWVAASRAEQGLPPTIVDEAQARRLARMDLRMGTSAVEADSA